MTRYSRISFFTDTTRKSKPDQRRLAVKVFVNSFYLKYYRYLFLHALSLSLYLYLYLSSKISYIHIFRFVTVKVNVNLVTRNTSPASVQPYKVCSALIIDPSPPFVFSFTYIVMKCVMYIARRIFTTITTVLSVSPFFSRQYQLTVQKTAML